MDVSLAYTGSHVEGIRRSAKAVGPYCGVGLSGCGRYVGRRVMEVLTDLKAQGKIKAIGAANVDIKQIQEYLDRKSVV